MYYNMTPEDIFPDKLGKKYATVIMRCQPPHLAHLELIQRIIDDGYKPLVLLGSANNEDKIRNPYTYEQRDKMLEDIFPGIMTSPLNDYDDWDTWLDEIENIMEIYDSTVFYTFNKEEDKYRYFIANCMEYEEAYFSDAINDRGIAIINITETSYPELHARDIRDDLEANRHFVRYSTYEYIKGIQDEK